MGTKRLRSWFFQGTSKDRFLTDDKPKQSTLEDLLQSTVIKWVTNPEEDSDEHDFATKSDIKTGTNTSKVVSPNNLPTFLGDYEISGDLTPDNVVPSNDNSSFEIPASTISLLDTDANTVPKLIVGGKLTDSFLSLLRKYSYMLKNLWYPTRVFSQSIISALNYKKSIGGSYASMSYTTSNFVKLEVGNVTEISFSIQIGNRLNTLLSSGDNLIFKVSFPSSNIKSNTYNQLIPNPNNIATLVDAGFTTSNKIEVGFVYSISLVSSNTEIEIVFPKETVNNALSSFNSINANYVLATTIKLIHH
jgi:hypothetical protein